MAKLLPGGMITGICGSVGSTTFLLSAGGVTVKVRNRIQFGAIRIRVTSIGTWSQGIALWQNFLSQAQRNAWSIFAAANPVTKCFGFTFQTNGFAMFQHVNNNLIRRGLPTIIVPPASLAVSPNGVISATAAGPAGPITISGGPPALTADEFVIIAATRRLSAGVMQPPRTTTVIFDGPLATLAPWLITPEYIAHFGNPVTGTQISFTLHLLNKSNGGVSAKQSAMALVT